MYEVKKIKKSYRSDPENRTDQAKKRCRSRRLRFYPSTLLPTRIESTVEPTIKPEQKHNKSRLAKSAKRAKKVQLIGFDNLMLYGLIWRL